MDEADSVLAQLPPGLLDSGRTLAAVLGDPVAHSRSPKLHGHWLAHYGLEGDYLALRVPEGQLAAALHTLREHGFAGCNLTLPHKESALPLMDGLDAAARAIGAVNTVVFEDGRMMGRNTDAYGFIESLKVGLAAQKTKLERHLAEVVVLGAGGAARAVVYALLESGAGKISLFNRSPDRSAALVRDFRALGKDRLAARPWEDLGFALGRATLLVNATSLGMQGQPPLTLPLESLNRACAVTDIVYSPLRTALLTRAQAQGCPTVDGLGMLLHQARAGFAAWFGRLPEVTPALRAAVLA